MKSKQMANLNLTQEKLQALRSEYKHRNVKSKYPRQKMLPEYRDIYPWVMPDEVDPYFAFCTMCECRLSAKRSDLGKHEGSIKHTENAAKKVLDGVILKGLKQNSNSSMFGHVQADAGEETDEDLPYIKHEPIMDLVENSSSALNSEELNQQTTDSAHFRFPEDVDDDNEDDVGDDDDEDEDDDVTYLMPTKRRCSDTDSQSQHSSTLDFLPLHVTINESNTLQRFSIREIPAIGTYANTQPIAATSMHYSSQSSAAVNTPQTPCKITIKKILNPLTTATPSHVTSTATITPVPAHIALPQQALRGSALQASLSQPQVGAIPPLVSLTPQTAAVATAPIFRDSFDLFFDSICASVKSLPPKLATEGKIRVMQIIGELEMRAIVEREQGTADGNGGGRCCSGPGGQQNATVASTTK